jgi:membrane peptidoglycan carboxypeptidase
MTELAASLEVNQKKSKAERGGSTLSQQLAKILVTGGEQSADRKLRELLYAVEMEQTLGKARILQLYLDNAPWGARICGAETAARSYFKRSARNLEPAQAVWLAAMLNNPALAVRKWQQEGNINLDRAKWVADGVRGISKPQRDALLRSVAAARFAPP